MGKMVEKKITLCSFYRQFCIFFPAKPDAREQNTGGHQREAE
jgi:hypothetical protein